MERLFGLLFRPRKGEVPPPLALLFIPRGTRIFCSGGIVEGLPERRDLFPKQEEASPRRLDWRERDAADKTSVYLRGEFYCLTGRCPLPSLSPLLLHGRDGPLFFLFFEEIRRGPFFFQLVSKDLVLLFFFSPFGAFPFPQEKEKKFPNLHHFRNTESFLFLPGT